MEVLVLDGKSYVKASKAARDLGYATDYVGQLCRTGQVDAHLIGRTWYVDQEQLGTHRVEKKRMSRAKAREQAKKLIIAQRGTLVSMKSKRGSKNIAISYEGDESPLIPETRKLSIFSERTQHSPYHEKEDEQENIIENKGEKIRMSGGLKVVDVTDEPIDDNVTVMRPTLIRSRPTEVPHSHGAITEDAHSESRRITVSESSFVSRTENHPFRDSNSDDHDDEEVKVQFSDRLEQLAAYQRADEDTDSASVTSTLPATMSDNGGKYSYFMHFMLHMIILVSVFSSFAVSRWLTYDTERVEMFRSGWNFSVQEAIARFSERF